MSMAFERSIPECEQLCWQVDSAIMDQCDNDACVPVCSRLKNGNLLSGVITQINVLATITQASTWFLDNFQ
jgi:hypothetical protein